MYVCQRLKNHCKAVDEIIKIAVVKTYCLPVGAHDLSMCCVQDQAVCWNDCFGFNRYESFKDVQ